jgi:translation elongation factor EF-1beta
MEELNVIAQLKIYVEDPAAIPTVTDEIAKLAKVQKSWEEDIGFGIKVLKVSLLLADSEGVMDNLESKIKEINNVSNVEVDSVERV